MSYCEIISFKDGVPDESVEYRNAHGGAPFIWDALFDTYLKDPRVEYDSWLMRFSRDSGDKSLWDLAKREDLPMYERAVHAATFDRAMVRKEHFRQFALDLRAFVERHRNGERVCHLLEWADFVDACKAEAVGFYGTSVSDNLWEDRDEEERVPYNLNTRDEHFEVYDWLEELGTSKEEP
jgi:hypothetical protein